MLTLIRSPVPNSTRAGGSFPEELAGWTMQVRREPRRCLWVAPTERQRRDLLRAESERAVVSLTALHTIESLTARALECSPRQRPWIGGPERRLRLARAWQEVVGRPPGAGLVRQLDRFVRDWQACTLAIPNPAADVFEEVVQRYSNDLETDQLLDRMKGVSLLTAEVLDPASWPNRLYFDGIKAIFFDGFHRLETVEVNLIAALARRCDVWLWLVGMPGQIGWRTLEEITRSLRQRGQQTSVIDFVPPSVGLSALGRTLFPSGGEGKTRARGEIDVRPAVSPANAAVWKLEAADRAAEVETAAKRIKTAFLDSQETGRPLRLSDVAVVIPGPAYDPLIREIFPRLGLMFHGAGRSLPVSVSRPARILMAAWELSRGQWRHDLLLDFLSQPLVKDRLKESHRLYDLFQERPRVRRQLDYAAWAGAWDEQVRRLEDKIRRWRSGELSQPERVTDLKDFADGQEKLADSLKRLIASIKTVLAPVAIMDRLLTSPAAVGSMRALVQACFDLLGTIRVEQWLSPTDEPATVPAVPWVEYEKDQRAYERLIVVLRAVARMPETRLPLNRDKRPDGFTALHLALESETYEIDAEDDAGVQVCEAGEMPGRRFRQVYLLGLLDGQVPPLADVGLLANRARHDSALAEQLQRKEDEYAHLFSQSFEAAEECVILCRPTLEEGQTTLPSRFLTVVESRVAVPVVPAPAVVASLREAGRRLGKSGAGGRALGKSVEELWPGAVGAQTVRLKRLLTGLAIHQSRGGWARPVVIEAEALIRLLFRQERAFSLSELETYAACPFRYFGARALRLEERDPDQTRIHYGNLIHHVLQLFYEERRAQFPGASTEPLGPIAPSHHQRLLELFDAEWAKLDDGTLPPDLKTLFTWEGGVLHLLLEAVGYIEADHGNYLNEQVLEDGKAKSVPLGIDRHGLEVRLSGTVDCVGLRRDNPRRAIVLDYKTGRAASRKDLGAKMVDGRLLQLPLYGAALEVMFPDLKVVGGAYVHLSEKEAEARKAVCAAGDLLPANGRADPLPFDLEAARAKAIALVGEIRAGRFPLTIHDAGQPHGECNFFCTLRHACRHPKGYRTPYGS